jgi:NRPS condensation-like uncharacterized protein
MSAHLRPLSPIERTFWRLNAGASLNFTVIAHVRGTLDLRAIGQALLSVQERHPMLRATLETSNPDEPILVADAAGPLRVRLGSDDWRTEVERELATPLNEQIGPLVRAVWIPEVGGGRLLLTFHHAISDAWSGVYVARDALVAIAASEGHGRAAGPLEDVEAVDDRLVPKASGFLGTLSALLHVLREVVSMLVRGRPVRLLEDEDVPCTERGVRIVAVEIDEDTAGTIAARARKEGTTVHGALLAAIGLGVAADHGKGRHSMALGTPINLRDTLEPSPGEGVGFYVSMHAFRRRVSEDDDLWELARGIRRAVHGAIESDTGHVTLAALPLIYNNFRGSKRTPQELAEVWERKLYGSGGLTNLGKLGLDTRYGSVELMTMQFAVATGALGTYACAATSTRGEIALNFSFADPTFTAEHADAVVERTLGFLLGALESPSE